MKAVAHADAGYSLIELLVATAVLGLVMAGLLVILRSGTTTYRWGAARIEAQQSARAALERMAKELRGAGYDPTSAGIAAIVIAEPARVAFQWDLDGDGVVDPTRERVTFVLRPGESILRRDAGGGAQPIINGVKRFALTYFDARRARHDRSRRRRLHPHPDRGRARRARVSRCARRRLSETAAGEGSARHRRLERLPGHGSGVPGQLPAPGVPLDPPLGRDPRSGRSTPGSPRRSATTLRPADPRGALRGGGGSGSRAGPVFGLSSQPR